jgi:acetolactate synthase-1/2/3 large subunit
MATFGEMIPGLLAAHGIDTVFGIPGLHTLELYRGLPGSGLRHITPRHEEGAGFMADGYARVTGRPAACFVISGPGITNLLTPMAQALADSVPMLVISSVIARSSMGRGEGRLHELQNQRDLVAGCARWSHTVMDPEEIGSLLKRAFSDFKNSRPGPIHIEIPTDVLKLPGPNLLDVSVGPGSDASQGEPTSAAVDEAAQLLANSRRPLIAIGGGVLGAAEELLDVANRLAAPIVQTVNAKGIVAGAHPLFVGGSPSLEPIREAFREADVVLAVGTELGETDYDFFFVGDIEIPGSLIRVDIDPRQLMRSPRPKVALEGDARQILESLRTRLSDASPRESAAGRARARELRSRLEALRDRDYEKFFSTLHDGLSNPRIVGDSTQPVYYAWLHYETDQPRSYFHSASGFGTLGYAIPAALGAQLGDPERPVVALIGDGGAQYTWMELASGVEEGLPIMVIVWNNHGYEEIRRLMDQEQVERVAVDLKAPDFSKLAEGLGCHYVRPTGHAELEAALSAGLRASVPTVIEVSEEDFRGSIDG